MGDGAGSGLSAAEAFGDGEFSAERRGSGLCCGHGGARHRGGRHRNSTRGPGVEGLPRRGGGLEPVDEELGDFLVNEFLDLRQLVALIPEDKRDRLAGFTHARRPPDAMDIDLDVLRRVEVDDVCDVVNVDSSGGEVGGDEHGDLVIAEALHDLFAFLLDEVAVDLSGVDTLGVESLCEFARTVFGVAEDDRKAGFLGFEKEPQQSESVPGIHGAVILRDLGDGQLVPGDVDLDGVVHVLVCEPLDLVVYGRGDEGGLMRVVDPAEDSSDVVAEPDVEHTVHLIENGEAKGVELQGTAVEEIHDTARRSNDGMGAAAELVELRLDARPAVDGYAVEFHELGESAELSNDLRGEFAGGREDEGLHPTLGIDHLEDRQSEGGGLSRAGLGLTEHILAGEDVWDHLGLDLGGLVIFEVGQGAQGRCFKSEFGECFWQVRVSGHQCDRSSRRRLATANQHGKGIAGTRQPLPGRQLGLSQTRRMGRDLSPSALSCLVCRVDPPDG